MSILKNPEEFEFLFSIAFPSYITSVKVSSKQNPKYYSITSGKGRVKKTPPKHKVKDQSYKVDKSGFYLDEQGNRIVANTKTVGKPKFIPINNQYIYNGKGSHFTRANIVNGLEDYYMPIIMEKIVPIEKHDLPIIIECELHAVPNNNLPDGDNFGTIYYKVFSDCLVKSKIIPDDKLYFISKPGCAPLFFPIKDEKNRNLIFHFYADKRTANKELAIEKYDDYFKKRL